MSIVVDHGSDPRCVWAFVAEARGDDLRGAGSTVVFDGGRAMLYGNVSEGVLRATVAELVAGVEPGASRC